MDSDDSEEDDYEDYGDDETENIPPQPSMVIAQVNRQGGLSIPTKVELVQTVAKVVVEDYLDYYGIKNPHEISKIISYRQVGTTIRHSSTRSDS